MGFRYNPKDNGLSPEGSYRCVIRKAELATPPGKIPHIVLSMWDVNDMEREWPFVVDRLMLKGGFTPLTHSILERLGATRVGADGFAEVDHTLLVGKRVMVHVKHGSYVGQDGTPKTKLEIDRAAEGHGYECDESIYRDPLATPSSSEPPPASGPAPDEIPF